jgi:hypothetical protein
MARFEEVQMKLAESAKKYLEIFNMQVFIEQFTLDRECKLFLTLPEMEPPFPLSATISMTYDAFQTGMSLYEEEAPDDGTPEVDASVELEFTIMLPVMEGNPDMEGLLAEIEEEFPDTDPILSVREIFHSDEPSREYELSYYYDVEPGELMDSELYEEFFEELKGILELIYRRTSDYIDHSWYRGEE